MVEINTSEVVPSLLKLSSSSISTFNKCARLFWFDKFSNMGERSFTSDAIERGSLFHAGIAAALRQRNPKQNLVVATAAVDELYSSGTGSVDERDEAVEMLRYYLDDLGINTRNFAYKLNGVPMVEWEFEVSFDTFILRGSVDAVIKDTNGKIYLVDWKTRRTFYTDDVVEMDKQLYIYAAIVQAEGVKLDGAMQIQLNAPPQPLKFKVDSDINLASSINERTPKLTQALFEHSVAHMSPTEKMSAMLKVGAKIVPDSDFKRISAINLNRVEPIFNSILHTAERIAAERDFLPVYDSWTCKNCQWRLECYTKLGA